ncbi:DUF2884 family protein [Dyella sp. A6]|uniref:DUF2884 family protein n=1 Tax=Dyella aluminiiresistens TaxID=3069105 RepID=UPI002E786FB2|nr:DUF2884 family protein [Dyella sp. A6]
MSMANGTIILHADEVSLHVGGAPDASIEANGDFAVDGHKVATTAAEHALLAAYVQNVRDVREKGLSMGKTGVNMAVKAVSAAVSSSSGSADKAADAGSKRIKTLNMAICNDTAAIKQAQDALGNQLAAFKPYATIVGAADVSDCMKDAND